MNYLAHLHIADRSNSDLCGNLLGDFVRGKPDGKFELDVVRGIYLHRFVDGYTDQHQQVLSLKSVFPKPLRRFAPIALDVFWDHVLASRWDQFDERALEQFNQHALTTCIQNATNQMPSRFHHVLEAMVTGNWLASYIQLDNCFYAIERIAQRSAKLNPLAECVTHIDNEYQALSECFADLYKDVLLNSKIKQNELLSHCFTD